MLPQQVIKKPAPVVSPASKVVANHTENCTNGAQNGSVNPDGKSCLGGEQNMKELNEGEVSDAKAAGGDKSAETKTRRISVATRREEKILADEREIRKELHRMKSFDEDAFECESVNGWAMLIDNGKKVSGSRKMSRQGSVQTCSSSIKEFQHKRSGSLDMEKIITSEVTTFPSIFTVNLLIFSWNHVIYPSIL